MQFTLDQLVDRLAEQHRYLIAAIADPAGLGANLGITGAKALNMASEHELVFCKSNRPELLKALMASRSRVVVTLPEITPLLDDEYRSERLLVLTPKPRLLMALLLAPFIRPSPLSSQTIAIHPDALVHSTTKLGPGIVLGADVQIGPNCAIGANTVIDHCTIGHDTWIGNNCSIGGDGFGFETDEDTGLIIKIPHFCRVQIGNHVEMSSNDAIDRGSMRDTILEDEVKLDNMVHIAHNCLVKRGALLTANVTLSGSVTIGEYAWVAPTSTLINGMTMGRLAMTGLGAVAVKDIPENMIAVGVPARPLRQRFPEDHGLL